MNQLWGRGRGRPSQKSSSRSIRAESGSDGSRINLMAYSKLVLPILFSPTIPACLLKLTLRIRCGQRIYGYEINCQSRLLNLDVSGHLCGSASTLGGVRDEQVQRQLSHYHQGDTQAQNESPWRNICRVFSDLGVTVRG